MTINECLEYIRERGLWVNIIIDNDGDIIVMPETPPNKSACMHSVLTPAFVSCTDLYQVLNKTIERLKVIYNNETGDCYDARN